MNLSIRVLAAMHFAAVLLLIPRAWCQTDPLAYFEGTAEPTAARRGETVTVHVKVDVEEGWHLYSTRRYEDAEFAPEPTRVALPQGVPFTLAGEAQGPKPVTKFDEGFGQEIEFYEGDFTLEVPVHVEAQAPVGETTLDLLVTYMACNDSSCTPPTEARVAVPLTIDEGDPRPEYAGNSEKPQPGAPRTPPLSPSGGGDQGRGFWAFCGLAISMGLLALLTPCVFPMIPITVSFFTGQEDRTRAQAVRLALTYGLGIVLTYTGIGLLLAVTLGAAGANQLAASPWFNLFVTALFAAFALSMFGLFELRLPSSFLQFSSQQQGRGGTVGVLFMALTFALVSFSCTSAFVGVLLVQAAQGEWTRPLVGMALFSASLALPFVLLAMFPGFLRSLPKSGEWMESIKVVMGFLLVAAATKFLSNVDASWGWGLLSRPLVLAVWIVSFGMAAFYLLGKLPLAGHGAAASGIGVGRLVLAMGFLSIALYLCAGLAGQPLSGALNAYLPAEAALTSTGSANVAESLQWETDYKAALALAKREGKPVFVDFSGKTCTNCRWMEANIFPKPAVHSLLEQFVTVKLMTDLGPDAKANRALQSERFGTVALPLYVLLTAEGEESARSAGLTRDPAAFAAFLEQGLAPDGTAATEPTGGE